MRSAQDGVAEGSKQNVAPCGVAVAAAATAAAMTLDEEEEEAAMAVSLSDLCGGGG